MKRSIAMLCLLTALAMPGILRAEISMDVDTAVTVPCNKVPLVDDTDGKTIDESVAYNAAGMDLNWNFVTTAGVQTQTNITPTTGGDYDWSHVGNGLFKIEIPATGGASANNDTEGYGWITGVCTGALPWAGPIIQFRAAATNNALVDGSLEVGLLNDAITSAKFDESTAYPFLAGDGLTANIEGTLSGRDLLSGIAAVEFGKLTIDKTDDPTYWDISYWDVATGATARVIKNNAQADGTRDNPTITAPY